MRKSLEVKMAAAALNKSSGSSSLAVLAETAALEKIMQPTWKNIFRNRVMLMEMLMAMKMTLSLKSMAVSAM